MSAVAPEVATRPTDRGAVAAGPLLYVLKRFPRLSETFILREILALEASGERILIDSLLPPEDGPRHPDLEAVRAAVRYVPKHPRLRTAEVARVHLRLARRHPLRWVRLAVRARWRGTWRRFVQAGIVADRAVREDARHIHAHFVTAAAEVARDAGALAGISVTATAHAKDIFHRDNAGLVRSRTRGMARVVTVSEYNARYLRDTVARRTPVHVVPNGVGATDPSRDHPDGPVLCVARLVPKKGLDVLVEAAALLQGRAEDLRVEIVGHGPLEEPLRARADELGIADRVAFLGPRPWNEVEEAFRRCSMVVLACRVDQDGDRDGMPTVLTEALARALPVVSTRVAGIPELVRDGETGLLVPPDDPAALADAIETLRDDRALARRLGRAGRDFVLERFDSARSAAMLRDLFERSP